MTVIDGDSHIYEPRNMWLDYTPAADRDLALRIEEDSLGYSWIMLRGDAIDRPAWVAGPTGGDFSEMGRGRQHFLAGKQNPSRNYTELPDDWWSAAARVKKLDEWGIDESLVFNQNGFQWEAPLYPDIDASRVNMAAWNRWAVELAADGGGRIHPVGHVRIDLDTRWLEEQLEILSRGGVRFCMFTPLLVEGRRLSHPDLDRVWRLFLDKGVTPTWHITLNMQRVIAGSEGWCDNDHGVMIKLVPMLFTRIAVEIALIDLAVNGVFERYPSLRLLLAELGADWFPELCQRADGSWKNYEQLAGVPFSALPRSPSEYLRERTVIVCSFPTDINPVLMDYCPDILAYGGDYPHPEGLDDPFAQYRLRLGEVTPAADSAFFGNNMASLLT